MLQGLHEREPSVVPHVLPARDELEALTADLPLVVNDVQDSAGLYLVVLQVWVGEWVFGWGLSRQRRVRGRDLAGSAGGRPGAPV
jgi:hypothetical protein